MDGKAIGKKVLGVGTQILLIAAGVIVGTFILEQMRKPRIAPPDSTATTTPAS